MRMARRSLQDPPRRFRGEEPVKHNGHIGPGPKPGPKRAVNVSVDTEILKVAKEMQINLSQALEDTLRKATEAERAQRFYDENKEWFDAQNARIEKYGTLTEALYGADAFDDPSV
ncbi:MAG TPA: type II toxin-antitoxin system CcdA family antitoxin [Rhizomicrobium sp.]|jgi:antitoxin CcdA|nr:type II toxin-antitoxin system CcdA family antitoxin [Rhizomicrobium sp.]